jgi:hypothetical protein
LAQSQAEYNAQVDAAKAKISAAQEALVKAQTEYNDALAIGASLNSQISQAEQNLQAAQTAYNQSLIPDPSWIRPTVEETYTVSVPYTIEVPYVVQEPVVTTVTTTEQVANTTYTITGGVTAQMYNRRGYNNAPPLPYAGETPVLTTTVSNIDFQWGSGYILQQGNIWYAEDVIVKFTGNLLFPADGQYQFYAPGDDGVILNIAGMGLINDWRDKGGGGSVSQEVFIRGGVLYPFTLYYYENGGGAWVQLNSKLTTDSYWQVVPAAWLGTQVAETITYQEVTVTSDVTTYVDVTYYREETIYREEERVRIVPDENAVQPMIKDDSFLPAIVSAQSILDNLITLKTQNSVIIESASNDVTNKQQELNVAQQELEAIPPFREPTPTPTQTESTPEKSTTPEPEPTPTPEPSETTKPTESELRVEEAVAEIAALTDIAPEDLSDKQIEQLVEAANAVFETAEQGSPAYEQALEALSVAAVADDPQLPTELAAIPGAAAVLETFNALGNVGADMAPAVREEAEKTVIASVIATGAAVQATVTAATTASMTTTSSPSAGSSGSSDGGGGASAESKSAGRTNRKVK